MNKQKCLVNLLYCVIALVLIPACTVFVDRPTTSTTRPTPIISPSAIITAASSTQTATPFPSPQAVFLGSLGKGSASDVAWSPDGKLLAVASSNGYYIYNTQNWQVDSSFSAEAFGNGAISSLAFSGDGNDLIVSGYGGTPFWHYDLSGGQVGPWLESIVPTPVSAPVFSPDGSVFAFRNQACGQMENGGYNCSFSLELRDSDSGELRCRLEQSENQRQIIIRSMVFSPDGKQIAIGGYDNYLRVWNAINGELLYELEHDSSVAGVDFSPDGRVLVSASKDATVRFWDAQTGESLFVLNGFTQGLQYVAYLENGTKLLVGRLYDNIFQEYSLDADYLPTIQLDIMMDAGPMFPDYSPADRTTTSQVYISPDTLKIAVLLNGMVQIWNLGDGQHLLDLPGYNSPVSVLAFSPDGRWLAVAAHTIHLWQVPNREFEATLEIGDTVLWAIVFHPNSKQLAVATGGGDVEIWDIESRQKLRSLEPDNGAFELAYSPDGKNLAVATGHGVQIWDVETGILSQEFDSDVGGEYDHPLQVAFSIDGRQVFRIGINSRWGWELATGETVYSLRASDAYYQSTLSTNRGLLGDRNSPLQFFDLITGQDLYSFANSQEGNIAVLSPDGRLVAWDMYRSIDLLDAASGNTLLSVEDSPNVSLLSFSPDSQILAASSYDGVIHLWNISSVAQYAAALPLLTATPAPTIAPMLTPSPEPIVPLALQPLALPTLEPGAISPENMALLEKRGELGLGGMRVAAWAPDGQSLAVGGYAGAYLFEFGATQPSHVLPAEGPVVLLTFSPDGSLLAGQLSNSAVLVWEAATGRSLYQLDNLGCWNQGMLFSPDQQVLSAYCGDVTYRWSMADGQLLSKDDTDAELFNTSPDGTLVVQVGMATARLLDAESRVILKTFDVPGLDLALAQFSPDGQTLLVWFYQFDIAPSGVYVPGGDPGSMIQLWNILPGQPPTLRTTLASGKWYKTSIMWEDFQGLAFTPDSRRLATASGDGQVQIWDTDSGKLLSTLPDGQRVYFSPDGRQLISIGKFVQVWNFSQGQPSLAWDIPGFSGYPAMLSFIQDGEQLVSGSEGAFQFWPQTGTSFATYPTVIAAPNTDTSLLAASPDGRWLAYSTAAELVLGENNADFPEWRVLKGFPDQPYAWALAATFSPNSLLLAIADLDRQVLLYRLDQPGRQPLVLPADTFVDRLFFSPDSQLLLGASNSQEATTLNLWNTTTGQLLRSWQTMAYRIAFHPDGVTLAVANYDKGPLRLFDLRTWNLVREMPVSPYVRDIAFNPDGSLLVVVYDEKIEFWDTASGELIRIIEGSFSRIAFSPDGTLLAIGLQNGKIEYWGLLEK